MSAKLSRSNEQLLERLAELNVTRGEIMRMARRGQLHEIRCEMPTCYCAKGRRFFKPRSSPMHEWALNADHYPQLKMDGGKLTPGNIRLAHVRCNNVDYWWRKRVRQMLDDGLSLELIARTLNKPSKKRVKAPHGTGIWTAGTVRKAYVS